LKYTVDQGNLHTEFSALNENFSSPSPDPVGSGRPAQEGVKEKYLCKKGIILPLLARLAWKRLQIGPDIQALVTGFSDLSTSMTLNDLEPSK